MLVGARNFMTGVSVSIAVAVTVSIAINAARY
jgi:hypothetical protein